MEQAFADSARDFLRAVSPPARLRALRDTVPGYEREVWQKMAEAGWTGLLAPEELGGLELGLGAAAAIATEIGRSLLPEPYLPTAIHAAAALAALPASALRDELLAGLAAGTRVVGLAWQESHGGAPTAGQIAGTRADAHGGSTAISGAKQWVYPAVADGWLVFCGGSAAGVHWVPAATAGLRVDTHARVDGSLAATLNLDQAMVPSGNRLADAEAAERALQHAHGCARAVQAAELLGIAEQAFQATLDYLKTRVQFGKPIGSNQALQHRMVDARLQVELAGAVLREFLDQPPEDAGRFAAGSGRVKARCAHAALLMTRLAIQFHGAIGYTDELDVGLYLKRALHLAGWLGGVQECRRLAYSGAGASEGEAETRAEPMDAGQDTDWNRVPEPVFRATIRRFLKENYPDALRNPPKRLHWADLKDWYLALSRQGWIAPAWPREHGGMGLDPDKLIAFIEEMEAYGVARTPDQGIINIGPVLIKYGTEAQRSKYLPKIISGENIWCQGYSEPNAGSDLASLRTEAVLEGDHFIVNGQKIWTTLAQDATHIFMLVRTDKTVKKQAGISFLLADMKSPGITVRPIRNIGGEEEFCEVFFDHVKVPKENLVGALNQGWTIAKALLDFERIFVGSPNQARYALNQLRLLGEARDLFADQAFADRYVASMLDVEDLQSLYAGYADIVKRGEPLPPSVSLLKIWATETYSRIAMEVVEAAQENGGDAATLWVGDTQITPCARLYNSAITTIYGGTNEIQRNILAKQVLGLPT